MLSRNGFARRLQGLAVPLIVFAVVAAGLPQASAFKPFTHVQAGNSVVGDAADGSLEIAGRQYPLDPAVAAALSDWPEFYAAGVIGPDGFPDLVYGNQVIHTEDTGEWMSHVFDAAWAAQDDTSYSAAQRSQILAFGYGFMMHAAGDIWAHTLVNDFSRGVFPAIAEIISDPEAAAIALRHIIVEAYIEDATLGKDGNRDRSTLSDGDVSDDSTFAIDLPTAAEFGGVSRFIYDTLIDPDAGTPTSGRGPLIGLFLELRSALEGAIDNFDPDPIETLADAWHDAKSEFDDVEAGAGRVLNLLDEFYDCGLLDLTCSRIIIGAEIIFAAAELGITVVVDGFAALYDLLEGAVIAAGETLGLAADVLIDAYLSAWIDDIDAGLRAWPELGRASTVAIMDPQARRDLQNEECHDEGSENSLLRAQCEADIGALAVLLDGVDPFINDHLLSMLGAPDFVGDTRAALQAVSELIDDIIGPILAINPLAELEAELQEYAIELVKELVEDSLGVDVDALKLFLTTPTSWLNVTGQLDFTLPIVGEVTLPPLFAQGDLARLDSYLGFDGTQRLPDDPPYDGFPYESSRLADDAAFDPSEFAIFDNTVMMGKLMLLDGATLDQLMSDLTGRSYSFYSRIPNANIMLTPLPGVVGASNTQWFSSIDGDHVWRSNGMPVFDAPTFGEGNFPLWESCVLRDAAFRTLFADWENGADQFPDLGDAASPDQNDPEPPMSFATPTGATYVNLPFTYLGVGAGLDITASDDYWGSPDISVKVRINDGNGDTTNLVATDGDNIPLNGFADGPMTVETTATDPCRTEITTVQAFILDTTPPELAVGGPYSGNEGDMIVLDGTATTDAGSGVDHTGWTSTPESLIDQGADPANFVPADNGAFTMVLSAVDNLGNGAQQDVVVTADNADPSVVIDSVGDGPDFFLPYVDAVLAASFNDPGTLDTHTASVDWGDGQSTPSTVDESPFGPPGSVTGLDGSVIDVHAWGSPGVYATVLTVADDDGGSGTDGRTVEVVDPIEALERTIDDLELLGDEAVGDALRHLVGPDTSGSASSGALDRLEAGTTLAAIVKIGLAIDELADAEVDTGFAELVLAQIVESVAAELEVAAIQENPSPPPGIAHQLELIAVDMSRGRLSAASGDYAAAVGFFMEAARRADALG